MQETRLKVAEIFASIQGESTYAGTTCFFVRLAGCNLRCVYCDTVFALEGGIEMEVDEVVKKCLESCTQTIEITGGEPLLQPAFEQLANKLIRASSRPVLVETNGSVDISVIPEGAIAIMDIKTPGSGEVASFDPSNLDRLRPCDEVKFVLTDRADYEWAGKFVCRHKLNERCKAVLFSPALGRIDPSEIGRWLLADGWPVRLQVPLHWILGMH